MKPTQVMLAAAGSIISLARVAAAAPLSGRWKIDTDMVQRSEQVCSFVQKGLHLQGTCTASNGTVKIIGKVAGTKVTWSYKTAYNGMPLTVSYSGNRKSGTKITGSTEVTQFGVQGTFTAVKEDPAKG